MKERTEKFTFRLHSADSVIYSILERFGIVPSVGVWYRFECKAVDKVFRIAPDQVVKANVLSSSSVRRMGL